MPTFHVCFLRLLGCVRGCVGAAVCIEAPLKQEQEVTIKQRSLSQWHVEEIHQKPVHC
jgi:hypothetical protein